MVVRSGRSARRKWRGRRCQHPRPSPVLSLSDWPSLSPTGRYADSGFTSTGARRPRPAMRAKKGPRDRRGQFDREEVPEHRTSGMPRHAPLWQNRVNEVLWRKKGGSVIHGTTGIDLRGRRGAGPRRSAMAAGGDGQSPRPCGRGDGNRENRYAPDTCRRVFHPRRAGLPGRCEGGSVGAGRGGIAHPQAAREAAGPRPDDRSGRLCLPGFSGNVLGSVRRAGSPDSRHGCGNGAAAARPPARPVRGAGGGAEHLLPAGRRGGAPAARPRRPARHARACGRECGGAQAALRQHLARLGRRDPAPASGAGEPGRRPLLRRAGAPAVGHDRARPRRARPHQPAGGRPADGQSAPVCHAAAVASVGAVRGSARGRRPGPAGDGVLLRRGASSVRFRPARAS
ncbi:MAG: hypothetical protein KatS3mg118_2990 [Paracoccaceae bacterium]|nr:MAG: hypothetical protein KatS3mg118_2990 [Paracoccaceae bacterium]